MQVEIWSDVVCPWCYIGKRRFEKALAGFEHADEVAVTYRSFELDPSAPFRPGRPMVEQLAAKYGRTVEQAEAMLADVDRTAADEGLDFDLAATPGGNTFDAHRLIHFADRFGRASEAKEALLDAYFRRRAAVSDPDVLVEVAAGVGLDEDEVRKLLDSDDLSAEVRADEAAAVELGITAVPYVVIDRAVGVPGAQDPDTFLRALEHGWKRSQPTLDEIAGSGEACGPVGCAVDEPGRGILDG